MSNQVVTRTLKASIHNQSQVCDDLLQPGESCPLSQSYCRKTIEQDGLLEIQDALAAGWADDPAYDVFELESYMESRRIPAA